MSTESAVSMFELELESAELLPSRETLCVPKCHSSGHSSSVTQVGYGNTNGGFINIANGSFNNILSVGSGNFL